MRRNVEPRSKILRRKPDFGHEDVPSRTRGPVRRVCADRSGFGPTNPPIATFSRAKLDGWILTERSLPKNTKWACCRARKTDVASDKRSETPHVLPRGAVTRHGDAFGDTASVEAFPRTKANASPRGPRRSSATHRVGRASHRVAATSVFRERGTEGNDSAEKRMRTFALAPRPPPRDASSECSSSSSDATRPRPARAGRGPRAGRTHRLASRARVPTGPDGNEENAPPVFVCAFSEPKPSAPRPPADAERSALLRAVRDAEEEASGSCNRDSARRRKARDGNGKARRFGAAFDGNRPRTPNRALYPARPLASRAAIKKRRYVG